MTAAVGFYFNADDKLAVACRLAAKANAQRLRTVVRVADRDTALRLDRMMWTAPALGFLPHCLAETPLAAETPVLIAIGDALPEAEVLLNLAPDRAPDWPRFRRVLEVVAQDAADRAAGRERYRGYRAEGVSPESHDLAADTR